MMETDSTMTVRGKREAASRVALDVYHPMQTASEIIGLLNTVDFERRNPFDDENFVARLKQMSMEFSNLTGSNQAAVSQILNKLDEELSKGRYFEARKTVTDLALYCMDQIQFFLQQEYLGGAFR
jgi:glutathione S-transferase